GTAGRNLAGGGTPRRGRHRGCARSAAPGRPAGGGQGFGRRDPARSLPGTAPRRNRTVAHRTRPVGSRHARSGNRKAARPAAVTGTAGGRRGATGANGATAGRTGGAAGQARGRATADRTA